MKSVHSKNSLPFLNRELSWLCFNERVLEEAEDPETPLLEKFFFLSVFSENLDEFFMIRVAGVYTKLSQGLTFSNAADGLDLVTLSQRIRKKVLLLQKRKETYSKTIIQNDLVKEKLFLLSPKDLDSKKLKFLDDYYRLSIAPALSPITIDVSHPFPFLSNLVTYLLIEFEDESLSFGLIQIPYLLERVIEISQKGETNQFFLFLEDIISFYSQELFQRKIRSKTLVRVTRDFDYSFKKSYVNDLKKSVSEKIIARHNQRAVRLEHTPGGSERLLSFVKEKLHLRGDQVYAFEFPYDYKGFRELVKLPLAHLKFPKFNPRIPPRLVLSENIFKCLDEGDLLLHHPYESFYTVGEFIQTAARDPKTVAIKQTLYRSSASSPMLEFLMEAARSGKDVTALIELTARFDEETNLDWSKRLVSSGVKVVYGFVGFKTHCKISLVLRKEKGRLSKYSHLSTGNYNPQTANAYTDLGLLTKNEEIGNDLIKIFNILTSFNGSFFQDKASLAKIKLPKFKHLIPAPFCMREVLIEFIRKTKDFKKEGIPGLIVIKVNALIDPYIIKELYEASSRGVKIHLLVRSACSLRPGLEGFSENIIVTSIVDRFLEHSRIFYFKSESIDKLFLGSADLMERNLNSRIEVLFPILEEDLKNRVIGEILQTYFQDNVKARYLLPDGQYVSPKRTKKKLRAQSKFIELARSEGVKSEPYKRAIYHYLQKKGKRPVLYDN